MAQILTLASLVALMWWLGWHNPGPLARPGHHHVRVRHRQPADRAPFERRIYRAPANEFLRGAADLTFGVVILGLGFFMLMWMIATA